MSKNIQQIKSLIKKINQFTKKSRKSRRSCPSNRIAIDKKLHVRSRECAGGYRIQHDAQTRKKKIGSINLKLKKEKNHHKK